MFARKIAFHVLHANEQFTVGLCEAAPPRVLGCPRPFRETGQPETGTGTVRIMGSSLLATKSGAWLTAFRVVRGRRVLYLGAAPRLLPPAPISLPETREGNEALRCLCGLLLESRALRLPFHPLAELRARFWPSGVLAPPIGPSQPTASRTIHPPNLSPSAPY
jgi:hypothetical protein